MVLAIIIGILVLSLVLIKSADMVIVAVRRLTQDKKVGAFAISAFILAIGTSFPELFVGITSALEGSSKLILGVVLGSNIANISIVAGLTAFIAGKIKIKTGHLKHDTSIAFVAGLLPIILVLDGSLNRVDGLILLSIYFAYATSFFKKQYMEIGEEFEKESFIYRFFTKKRVLDGQSTKEYGRLFIGVAMLLFSADAIVRLSQTLAVLSGIPVFVIGLVVLAVGTSLPEFAFSLRSVDSDEPEMFFGNVLGSIIANSTLIVGLAALISPIHVQLANGYLTASATFVVVFLLFWRFVRTKFTLERWEASILLLVYVIFILVEFL